MCLPRHLRGDTGLSQDPLTSLLMLWGFSQALWGCSKCSLDSFQHLLQEYVVYLPEISIIIILILSRLPEAKAFTGLLYPATSSPDPGTDSSMCTSRLCVTQSCPVSAELRSRLGLPQPTPRQGSGMRLPALGALSNFCYSMKEEEMLGLVDPASMTMNTYNHKKILLKQ